MPGEAKGMKGGYTQTVLGQNWTAQKIGDGGGCGCGSDVCPICLVSVLSPHLSFLGKRGPQGKRKADPPPLTHGPFGARRLPGQATWGRRRGEAAFSLVAVGLRGTRGSRW